MADLRTVLSPQAVAALAAGYDDASFRAANQHAVQALYPPVAVLTDAVLDGYWPAPGGAAALLAPRERELAVVTALAATGGSAANLAIHLYVGLAVGATVDELVGTLGVVGSYAGVSRLMDGLTVFETTLNVLGTQVAKGEAGVMAVVPALKSTFPLSVPVAPAPVAPAPTVTPTATVDAKAGKAAKKAKKAEKQKGKAKGAEAAAPA